MNSLPLSHITCPPAWEAISEAPWLVCGEVEGFGSGYWNTCRKIHRWCFTFTLGRKWLTNWKWLGSLCHRTSGAGWLKRGERWEGWLANQQKQSVCVSVWRAAWYMCVVVLIALFLLIRVGLVWMLKCWIQRGHCWEGFVNIFLGEILVHCFKNLEVCINYFSCF